MIELKFLQKKKINCKKLFLNVINFQGKKLSFNIVACPIGNTLGACAWQIQCDLLNIIYLISYNLLQEELGNI